jgi:hypothetical protein
MPNKTEISISLADGSSIVLSASSNMTALELTECLLNLIKTLEND